MAISTKKTDLGYLGEEFQFRLIHHFFGNKEFFKELSEIVDQNMFTNATLKLFVGLMKEHYRVYDTVPSYETMEILIRERARSEADKEIFEATLAQIRDVSDENGEYIKELGLKFFRQQNIVKTANEILKIAGDGNVDKYESCVELLNDAMHKGIATDDGSSVFEDLEETLSDDYRTPIPTGIGPIDKVLEGGLGKGELGVIVGPTGFGKVQPYDAEIITPEGIKPMQDIKVGDYVIGRDGKPTKVIGVYPHKDWQFYKVEFSDGVSCECGKEHLWAVNSYYQRSGKKYIKGLSKNRNDKFYSPDNSFKVMSLEEIMDKGLYRRGGRHNFKVPMCEPVEFAERQVSIDPYLFGYMIGDGCFSRNEITVGEQDFEESSRLLAECNFTFRERKDNNRNIYSLSYHSDFRNALMEYFDSKLTSEDKYIPDDYLYNSIENRIAVLNGLMDSDGTCMKNGCSCFNTKSQRLAENIKTLVLSLGGFAKVREKDAKYFNKKYGELRYCGIQYEVTITLCDPSIPIFRLTRKQDRVKYRTTFKGNRFIHNIEPSRVCDGQCIKVESDEELYLTNDFIVTHNTSLTTAMASFAATYKCPANNNNGFKVLQIVFEDRIKQIQRKHVARIATLQSGEDIESKNLSKPEYRELALAQVLNYPDKDLLDNNLKICRLANGDTTASMIKNFVKKLTNEGFKPDLMIVDYFECLDTSADAAKNSTNEWEKEGRTMRKFESMASELDLAIWIPSQGTKDSINAEVVTVDKMGGSFKKSQIAHIIISIARTMEDQKNNKATVAILKNRAGQSGKIFTDVNFNNGTCVIECDDTDDGMDFSQYGRMQQKDAQKTSMDLLERAVTGNTGNVG